MRIFINNADSYVGKALCADLRKVTEADNRLLGTVEGEAKVDVELMATMGVNRVVLRSDMQKYLADILSCSLIVFDLHTAKKEEVEYVIKELKVAELKHEVTFVLISSVNVWANTRKEYVPLRGEDEEEEEPPEEGEEGEAKEVKKRPRELTDADLDRRTPSPCYEGWKYLETLTLSLGSKEKLRPHVVAAGVLYGNGETTFNKLFEAAWLTLPIHKIIAPGENYIPCVHVRDVARLVRVVACDDSVGRYLLAVDHSRLTQAQIVQGIVNQISHKRDVPTVPIEEVDCKSKEVYWELDIILEPSAPLKASTFDWWCRDGIVANIEKVAAEFCKWRNLRPIKMVVTGPPGSGLETVSAKVAEKYLHQDPPHLTYDQIIEDACNENKRSARKLKRKVQKLAKKPGSKLPLKLRTKLVKAGLLSNVCRYRGYVLEGYPTTYAEAEALFMERILEEGEEPEVEEEEEEGEEGEDEAEGEEEEEEEAEEAPPAEEEDEEEEGTKPKFRLADNVAPEFCVVLQSSEQKCKDRIFCGEAKGASSEEDFLRKTAEYKLANLAEDGSPSTAEFFSEVGGLRVLPIDVDNCDAEQAFQAVRVYLESKGQFFNYLRSEEELVREREAEKTRLEKEADASKEAEQKDQAQKEADLRRKMANEEESRRTVIAQNEAAHLEAEAQPLRGYLLANVVPTLTAGLGEVCKEQPEDPIEYLAQYLFAHAQNIQNIQQGE